MKKVFEEVLNGKTYVQYFYNSADERTSHINDLELQGFGIDTDEGLYHEADKNHNITYVGCYVK